MRLNDRFRWSNGWHGLVVVGLVAALIVGVLVGATGAQAPDSSRQEPGTTFESVWPDLDSTDQYWLDGWAGRNGWDPLADMQEMEERMRKMFDHSAFGFTPGEMMGGISEFENVELTDEGDYFKVVVQAEDLDESSLDIEVHQETLIIHGKHANSVEEKDASGHITRKFHTSSSFSRVISLPEPVVPDEMTTHYSDGVLTIELPKETT